MKVMVCPTCGLKGRLPDAYQKDYVRCPKCRTTIELNAPAPAVEDSPASPPVNGDDLFGDTLPLAPTEPAFPAHMIKTEDPLEPVLSPPELGTGGAAPLPSEPWYYGFLSALAHFWIVLAILVGGFAMIGLFTFVLVNQREVSRLTAVTVITWFVTLVFSVWFLVSWMAFLLLALDAARNLRAIRHHISRPPQ